MTPYFLSAPSVGALLAFIRKLDLLNGLSLYQFINNKEEIMKNLITVSILALSLSACFDPVSNEDTVGETSANKQWSGEVPTLKSGDTPDSLVIYDAQKNIILEKSIDSNKELSGDYPDLKSESYPLEVIIFDDNEQSTYIIKEEATQSDSVKLPDEYENQIDCAASGCGDLIVKDSIVDNKDNCQETGCNDSTLVVDPIHDGCAEIYEPVCANGINFSNTCEAQTAGVQAFEFGVCKDSVQVSCPEIYSPVCMAGVTYSNECEALAMGIEPAIVQGACEDDKQVICPSIYSPVCAEGVTYGNTCEAEVAGAQNYENGECDEGELQCTANGCFDSDGNIVTGQDEKQTEEVKQQR